MTAILKRLDHWMFSAIDARQLAALRIGLSAILLVRLGKHDFLALANQPEGLYRPLSYMNAFDAMPGATLTRFLLATAFVTAFAAAIGYRSRLMLPVATVCALVLFGMTTSSGKVMHNDALMLLCLLPVAAGTTDSVWSISAWRNKHNKCNRTATAINGTNRTVHPTTSGWPWRVALLLVCGAYFFSGLAKLTHSGLYWVFSDNMRWILYANSDARAVPNQLAIFIAGHPWMARMSGASIFVLELAFPLVLFRPALRWVFVPAAVAMHALTWLTLELDYSAMAATAVVTCVSWPAVAQTARKRFLRNTLREIPRTSGTI